MGYKNGIMSTEGEGKVNISNLSLIFLIMSCFNYNCYGLWLLLLIWLGSKKKKSNNERKITMKEVITVKEMNIVVDRYSFLCIFGEYINGGFLAIPSLNICVDLSDADDFNYN